MKGNIDWTWNIHVNFFFVCQEFQAFIRSGIAFVRISYVDIYWYYVEIIIIFWALFTIRINRTREPICVSWSTLSTIRICIARITSIYPFIHSPIRPFIAWCITTHAHRTEDVCFECIHLPASLICLPSILSSIYFQSIWRKWLYLYDEIGMKIRISCNIGEMMHQYGVQ